MQATSQKPSALATIAYEACGGDPLLALAYALDMLEQIADERAIAAAAAAGLPPVAAAEEERRGELAEPQFALF